MYTNNTLLRGIIVSTLVAIALAGCGDAKQTSLAVQTPEVAVVTVRRSSVPVTTELPGRTSACLVAQARARVDGILLRRDFTEGGDVRPNEQLYQIALAPDRAALDSAVAALQTAEANLASTTAQAGTFALAFSHDAVAVSVSTVAENVHILSTLIERVSQR